MIKILFVIPGLSGGGAEKVLRNLVNNMDQTKFDITVQTIDQEEPEKYLAPGIHYKAINRCRTGFGKKLFSLWFRFCAEMKLAYRLFIRDDYDIEVAYLETIATKLIAQSTNQHTAKIAWVHCDLSKKEGMDAAAEKLRKQYKRFDKVVCVSEGVRQGFVKQIGADYETKVIYNVVDEEEIFQKAGETADAGIIGDDIQLLAVGRLSREKDFGHLIDTCSRLRKNGIRFRLAILGEGPERLKLEQQIREQGLQEIVEMKGFCANPYPYIKKADIIVCSSLYEGLSTVVLESLILGKAIVTTPCSGMTELLGDSEYGIIAEDGPDGLYDSLLGMLQSAELRGYYAEKAALRGSAFYKQTILKETESFFEAMLSCASGDNR